MAKKKEVKKKSPPRKTLIEKIEDSVGRPRIFDTPNDLHKQYMGYKAHIKANPIKEKHWVGKNADEVDKIYYKPPTWQGFEAFLFRKGICYDVENYRYNRDEKYNEFIGVIRAITNDMFDIKFSGASVGQYNQNIIARELGLAEKNEVNQIDRPILEGGKELPEDE